MACGSCKNSSQPARPSGNQIIKGSIGLTKALLGMDQAPDSVIEQRRSQCRVCEFATRNEKLQDRESKGLTTFSKCLKCGCNIKAKTTLMQETCPEGNW